MCSKKYNTITAERLCPCLSTANTSLLILGAVQEFFAGNRATNTAKQSPTHIQTTRATLSTLWEKGVQTPGKV